MLRAAALLCLAPLQQPPASLDRAASPEQAAFQERALHAVVSPAAGAAADPAQWVQVTHEADLGGLVVTVRGDEDWLPVLAESASAVGLPLGWALTGGRGALERLLALGAPFLVSVEGEERAECMAVLAERAPAALVEGGSRPQVASPAEAAAAQRWVVPLASAPVPSDLQAFEDLYLDTVGRGQNLAVELGLDGEGQVSEAGRRVLTDFAALRRRTFERDRAASGQVLASHTCAGFPAANAIDGDPATWWMSAPDRQRCFLDLDLGSTQVLDTVVLAEPLELGPRVRAYRLQARRNNTWSDVHLGTTIGARQVLRIDPEFYQGFRLIISEAEAAPAISTFAVFAAPPKVEVHVGETVFMGATEARFSTSSPDAQVRYTLDGSRPTADSTVYTGPVTIDRSCLLTALASSPGNPGLVTVSVRLRAYTPATLSAPVDPPTRPGLTARVWGGSWGKLAEVDWSAPPELEAVVTTVDPGALTREGRHALVFEGLVEAPQAGIYGLFARGAASVRVLVAEELAVASTGEGEVLGELGLQAGWHPIRIEVLREGDAGFRVQWRGPAISKRPFEARELGR